MAPAGPQGSTMIRSGDFEALRLVIILSTNTNMSIRKGQGLSILTVSLVYFAFTSMFFLVYYLGIEDNRRQARENFQSHVRIFKRRKVDSKKLKSKH